MAACVLDAASFCAKFSARVNKNPNELFRQSRFAHSKIIISVPSGDMGHSSLRYAADKKKNHNPPRAIYRQRCF